MLFTIDPRRSRTAPLSFQDDLRSGFQNRDVPVSSGAALGNYEFEFFQKLPLEFRRGAEAGKVVDSTAVIDSNGLG